MKKFIMVLLMLFASAQVFASSYQVDGVYEVGAGEEVQASLYYPNHTITSFYTDADDSITALSFTLQGSSDPLEVLEADAHWFDLAEHSYTATEITAKQAAFHVVNMPFTRVRVAVSVVTGADSSDEIYALHNFGR